MTVVTIDVGTQTGIQTCKFQCKEDETIFDNLCQSSGYLSIELRKNNEFVKNLAVFFPGYWNYYKIFDSCVES